MTTLPDPWVLMVNGKPWDLLNPTADMVDMTAIAFVLGRIPRFGGHTPRGVVSVAQHSVHVSYLVSAMLEMKDTPQHHRAVLYGLLHDAHEFVLGDVTTPVVTAVAALAGPDFKPAWDDLKSRADRAILEAAGLPPKMPADVKALVKKADQIALVLEAQAYMPADPQGNAWGMPTDEIIMYDVKQWRNAGFVPHDAWSADGAAKAFLATLEKRQLVAGGSRGKA
jgi:uncharacterized protein